MVDTDAPPPPPLLLGFISESVNASPPAERYGMVGGRLLPAVATVGVAFGSLFCTSMLFTGGGCDSSMTSNV